MARRQLDSLERVLGVNALFATAYGNVGGSIYYALGLVASYALGLTPIVFLITGFFFICTGASYTEATTMYPEAGGSSSFARHAFNEFWSFFAAWGQLLTYVATIAISAFFVPHYLAGLFWPSLSHSPGDVIFGCGVIVALGAINIVGVKESTGVNILLAVVDFFTQLTLVLIGIFLVLSPKQLVANVHFGVAPRWSDLLIAIPIGMLAYTGIETVSNMSEEAVDFARTVPGAINRVRIAVFAIYLTLPSIALSALPVHRTASGAYVTALGQPEQQGGFSGDPVLGVVTHLHLGLLQHVAETYVGLLAATILFLSTNAGLIGVSRLVYSMGIHRQMPDGLRRLHPKFRTPWIGIIVFSGFAIIVCLPGQADFLGNVYSFGALLSWTIAHMSVTRLRFKLPDAERPYRGPGNWRVRGVDLPLFAIAGGSFTAIAFVVIVVLHPAVAIVGVGWLVVGTVIYVLFRRHYGLDLTTTHKVALAHPATNREIEYDSVLIPALDGQYDEHALATAKKLAAPGKSGIHILSLVTVPYALPINARLESEFARAESVIDQARVQGGRRISGHVERVRAGQAGRRIIQTAADMHATAIVMPLPRRANGASAFGKTVETVLADRPCRVILESSPS